MSKSALPFSRLNAFRADPDELVLIEGPEDHPLYDPRVHLPLDPGLVKNIKKNNVLEPVLVRKNGDRIEVVDGRQRVKNAREANRQRREEGLPPHLIPLMVRNDEENEVAGIMVSANLRMEETPVSRAKKAQAMLNRGQSEEAVATSFGVKVVTVKEWCKLLTCAGPVKAAVESGRLTVGDAIDLARLPRDQQTAALAAAGGTSRGLRRTARQHGVRLRSNMVRMVKPSTLRRMLDVDVQHNILTPGEKVLLRWIVGIGSRAEVVQHIPEADGIIPR